MKKSKQKIENFVKNGEKSWQWYLNGKRTKQLPNEIILKSGDNILIKYE